MANRYWKQFRLGELGEVNRGRSRYRPRDAAHLYGGSYPFIQTGDIKASRGRITSHSQTYSEAGLAQSRIWPADTMVITIAANIAETAILSYPACFPDSVVGFVANPSKADVRFIEYQFRVMSRKIKHENIGTGSVQDNINLQTIDRLEFFVPDISEQKAIVSVLGSLDDLIETNRRTNETLEAMARAIFKDWFVDFGPVRAKAEGRAPYLAPDIWSLFPDALDDEDKPEGWEFMPLDQVADFLNGLAMQKYPPDGDDSIPVIKITELRSGITPKSDRASMNVPEQYIVRDGDILFSWSGSLMHLIWTGGIGGLNQHLFKVSSRKFPKWFYFLWLGHFMPSFQEIAASKATTMGHIQRHHLSEAIAIVPPPSVLQAGEQVVAPLIDQLIANNLENRALAQTRDFLLPKLMSGEIRVKDAEHLIQQAV